VIGMWQIPVFFEPTGAGERQVIVQ